MNTKNFFWGWLIILLVSGCTTGNNLRVEGLTCEYLVNPLGIDVETTSVSVGNYLTDTKHVQRLRPRFLSL